jgi:hypothetical protein
MTRREFLKAVTAVCCGKTAASPGRAGVVEASDDALGWAYDDQVRDYLYKMRHFDERHEGDVCLDEKLFPVLESCVSRLKRLERAVGHGNFQLLSFDEALETARNSSLVGAFSRPELDFMEMVFYENAAVYGFQGDKPLRGLTDRVKMREVKKVPRTGNYVFDGEPLATYERIVRDLGDRVLLTSGIRGVPKQFLLFFNKAYTNDGNMSLASRSLAPPGYSYHGVGDFDVGQVGFGAANFTERFTTTEVWKRLVDLGYVDFRYNQGNQLGVRFEPWHIKVMNA